MIYDFILIRDCPGDPVRICSNGGVYEAAHEAVEGLSRETGRAYSLAVYVPGERSLNELVNLNLTDLMNPGSSLTAFAIFYDDIIV